VQSTLESLFYFIYLFILFLHQINIARWMENEMSECVICKKWKEQRQEEFLA
jgi:hypothetical protein